MSPFQASANDHAIFFTVPQPIRRLLSNINSIASVKAMKYRRTSNHGYEVRKGVKTGKEQEDLERKVGEYIWQILEVKLTCISIPFYLR